MINVLWQHSPTKHSRRAVSSRKKSARRTQITGKLYLTLLKRRIIPVILLRNGSIVQSREFKRYQVLGSPFAAVERLSSWFSDELIYLDISNQQFQLGRQDLGGAPQAGNIMEVITRMSEKCFMPLTFGGGIRSLDDVRQRLKLGADKVTFNTRAQENEGLIKECVSLFGSQCVVLSVDAKRMQDGKYCVYHKASKRAVKELVPFIKKMQDIGIGEILLNSVDRDGAGNGFDIPLIQDVCEASGVPVIAMGGAGSIDDFETVLRQTSASAVAAANYFQHSENSVYLLKRHLYQKGYNIRKPPALSNESDHL